MKVTLRKITFVFVMLAMSQLAWAQGQPINFSVIADIPYGSSEVGELIQQVADHNLYSFSEFMVHLGDIKSGTSSCPQTNYSDVADILKQLKVPTYIVPGDNEWTDCSNPSQAWGYWTSHFSNFEDNFCGAPQTQHQSVRPENFAFVKSGVLFVGINLPAGQLSSSEGTTRMQQDADWVNEQLDANVSQVRGALVFGHAGNESPRNFFFDQFKVSVADFGKPVLYMMGNDHTFRRDDGWLTTANLTRITLDDGFPSLPLQVTANMEATNMWSVERVQWSVSSSPFNFAPCVNAGADQSVTFPAAANLSGEASDDGDPTGPLTTTWSKLSGPGAVTFGNPNAVATSASFNAGGTYVLRLSANDGVLQTTDDLTVNVTVLGPALAINDVTVTEGNAGTLDATFTVTLSNGTGGSVTVDYLTADGTAVQSSDYNSIAGTLSYSGATTIRTLSVPVIGDLTDEPDETFFVNLSNVVGATLGDAQGQGTITDDDLPPPPTISSFNPVQGYVSIEVTIAGSNFNGTSSVKFNGTSATTFIVDSPTQIRATVPIGATTGKINITNLGGTVDSATDFTVTAGGPPMTLLPAEDAYVSSAVPTTSFGSASSLRVRQSPSEMLYSYLKFSVSGVTGPVQSATLRLNVNNAGPETGGAYAVSNNFLGNATPWVQSTLNWNNAPAISGSPLSSVGAASVGAWVEFNVTAAITGNGTFSIAVKNNNTDAVHFSSKEGSPDPELVIQFGTGNPPPSITSFNPTSGLESTQVTLTGSYFSGATSVKFNGTAASTFFVDSATQIRANVPTGATSGEISVTTSSGTSTSASSFTVIPPAPVISSFTPTSGPVGTVVTITGSNFTGASSVLIDSIAASPYTVNLATQIIATVPVGATIGKISVTTAGGTALSATDYSVVPPPTITSFNPLSGIIGSVVTITGTNFTGATSAKFNSIAASTFTVNSATEIVATVPAGATTGKISVTTSGGTVLSANDYTVIPPPTVSSFTPTSGLEGALVTITGTNLTGATSVNFNNTAASTFTVNSDTQIQANVPIGATTGKVSVTTIAGTGTSASDFTVIPPPPTIASFNPTSGLAGVEVTVAGTNFINVSSVKFNNVNAASFLVDSAIQIRAIVSATATTGKISVTTPGGTAASVDDFTVSPPTIASFNPASGLVGVEVTIAGTNFVNVSSVKFNNVNAASFVVDSAIQIRAIVSATATTGKISVTTPGGTAVSTNDLIVPPTTIASFDPPSGVVGSEVTITGSNFTGASNVKFNTITAPTYVVDSATQIRATVPSGATTGKLSVTTVAGTAQSVNDFTVTLPPPPSIASFNPISSLVGSVVTITGANFTGASSVKFNNLAASTFTVNSATQIIANVPVGASTGKISVTTTDGTGESATDFTVLPSPPTISSFTPVSGPPTTIVTITGTHFTGATVAQFNGMSAASFTVISSTQIQAEVPSFATSGKISVTAPGGTIESATNFTATSGLPLITVTPAEDAYVKSSTPTTSFGTAANLRVRQSSSEILYSYLKFNVTGVSGPVLLAKLRVYCSDAGPDGGGVYAVSNDFLGNSTPWVQSTLNWNNAPAISGSPLSSIGAVTINNWFEFDVTAAVTGNGTFSFAIKNNNSDAVYYHSKESTNDPQLVIDVGSGPPLPIVSSFTPASGVVGVEVTIGGNYFNGVSSVKFNGTAAASYTVDSSTQIRATVPAGATTGKISVTASAGSGTSANNFTVLQPPPTIASFTPASGLVGLEVTISGTNFINVSDVDFNSVNAASYTIDSATQIRATVPATATTGKVSVTTPGGTAVSTNDFTVPPPTIASFNPPSGVVGSEVTITGSNFTGASNVKFNTTTAPTYTVDIATQIRATVPTGATTGKLSVTTIAGVAQSIDDFTVTLPPPPSVASFNPTSGIESTTITITGTNFTGASSVKFNNLAASTFTVNSATQIVANVPTGATTGPISVTHTGGTGASVDNFTVLPSPPTITSFTPTSGPATTMVTITGTHFTGATVVQFNAMNAASFTVMSSTQIQAQVPIGATSGKISVTTPGGSVESATNFSVSSGLPQVTVIVAEDAYVKSSTPTTSFGTAAALRVRLSTSEILYSYLKFNVTGVTGPVQTAKLRVYCSDAGPDGGGVYAVSNNFLGTSTPWVQSTLTWNNAPAISGSPLSSVAAVANNKWVEFDVTAAVTSNGTFSFAIKNNNSDAVYYHSKEGTNDPQLVIDIGSGPPSPVVSSFTPTSGLTGIEVTISGNHFTGVSSVKFNNAEAASYIVDSSTLIRATVPTAATTGKISVTGSAGSGISAANFTVIPPAPAIASFNPISALVGIEVTITGANFTGASNVKFNTTNVTLYTVDSATQLRATVPAGATTGKISVTAPGGTAVSIDDFTVTLPPAPSIASFTPTSGPTGTEVTITGGNFTGASSVKFNDVNASSFIIDGDTQIRATVPATATTGKISVTTGGGTTPSVDDYTVTFPGGTTVTFNPTDDAYVRSGASESTNFGISTTLRVRQTSSDVLNTYLKFNVGGLSSSVTNAKLRLKVVDAGADGGSLHVVSNDYEGIATPWTEAGLLWTNAPAISSSPLHSIGTATNGSIIEIDVTAVVTGNGIYSFGIKTASSDAVHYQSKEGATKPELVIQTASTTLTTQSHPDDETESEEEEEEESKTDSGYQPGGMPTKLVLTFAYPNPFNAQTRIEYGLPEESHVRLMIFNSLGQLITTLVDETQSPGYKRVIWNGKDKHGLPVSSGIYLYTLEAGQRRLTGKVVFQQ